MADISVPQNRRTELDLLWETAYAVKNKAHVGKKPVQHCSPTLLLMHRLEKVMTKKYYLVVYCGALWKERCSRSESFSMERDQPLYSVTLLHQRSLVHGPDPAIHVLLCVRTEEICPHPAVFCL